MPDTVGLADLSRRSPSGELNSFGDFARAGNCELHRASDDLRDDVRVGFGLLTL
jgi:hypothetical protein